MVNKPTISQKLKSENKPRSSFAVVSLVVFITITVFIFILAVKSITTNKKEGKQNSENLSEETKELDEVKIEPNPENKSTYTVKEGDTLYLIGIEHGINWENIADENNLKEPYLLIEGQELKIPKTKNN